jgi:hypothetical protein
MPPALFSSAPTFTVMVCEQRQTSMTFQDFEKDTGGGGCSNIGDEGCEATAVAAIVATRDAKRIFRVSMLVWE